MTDPYTAPKADLETVREFGKPRQSLKQRFLWFLVGGVVAYLLIALPFKHLRQANPDWHLALVSACSVGINTCFFFFWNYFVNFRTDSRKRDAFARYVTAVIVLALIQTTLLTIFKHFDVLRIEKSPIDLDVVTTQACMGWMKFLVYHKWAFPASKVAVADGA